MIELDDIDTSSGLEGLYTTGISGASESESAKVIRFRVLGSALDAAMFCPAVEVEIEWAFFAELILGQQKLLIQNKHFC